MISVRTRILLFFTLFAVVSFAALYLSNRSVQTIAEAASGVVNEHLPMVQWLDRMEVAVEKQNNDIYRSVISKDAKWLDEVELDRAEFARAFSEVQKWALEAEQERLAQIDETYVDYDNETRMVLLNALHGLPQAVPLQKADKDMMKIQSLIEEISLLRQGMTLSDQGQISQTVTSHRRFGYYFLFTIAAFFLFLAFYLWRFLVQPLTLLLEGIRNFTHGKTDVQIPPVGKDELGELQEAFNEMSREIDSERRRLRTESQSDSLTGLYNMRYFRIQLAEEFSRSQRYARPLTLLMIDVDHFKGYNDRNGHPAGDIVLKEVSRILNRNVRGTDVIARYGGEEFVVLLPETPLESALHVAEKIRNAVEGHHFPFAAHQGGQRLTVSVGVASYPDNHITSDQDLIECSDKALYAAKKNGRNQVFVFSKGETASATQILQPFKESAVLKK